MITDGPLVKANVSPQMRERLDELADARAVSVAALIREALEHAYGPQQRAPEPFPQGSNLRPPTFPRGFMQ